MKSVLIVGGGFVGINAAKQLGNHRQIQVTLVDRKNHHLFQPLLYQVAMAGLSPADIAVPIRSLMSRYRNCRVLQAEVTGLDLPANRIVTNVGSMTFDYLILASGSKHSYFGHRDWETFAPGLKTIEQATEIRRRVLSAFEVAERCDDRAQQKKQLSFVIVGGGPTGVELAGAIGEMTRFTLAKDFRNVDVALTRIILVEGQSRILPMFSEKQANRAARFLETLGVQVWTNSTVRSVDSSGVHLDNEHIEAATVLWAAGVEASELGRMTGGEVDRSGRVHVQNDLSLPHAPNVFVAGDLAYLIGQNGNLLPGTAPVAMQQGQFLGRLISQEIAGKPRRPFRFVDKGQMATIGRSRAIIEIGNFHMSGRIAWLIWLVVHIYYLTGFRNRLAVVLQWAWSYLTFRRGARLIVDKKWEFYS